MIIGHAHTYALRLKKSLYLLRRFLTSRLSRMQAGGLEPSKKFSF